MKVPTICGFPLWYGRIKPRVAKKHLNMDSCGSWLLEQARKSRWLRDLKVGDLINECSGFNSEIVSMYPAYHQVRGGWILYNIEFQTKTTGCSLLGCGVEPPLSREIIEEQYVRFTREWIMNEQGKTWFGATWPEEAQKAQAMLDFIAAGGHIADEYGQRVNKDSAL